MTDDDDRLTAPSDWEAMIQAAVEELIAHEDPQRFLVWMQETMPERFRGALPPTDLQMLRQIVTKLAYTIAAGVPLPGNNFRPKPLPPPKRNDRCPCGSGRKYKQCCASLPVFPDFEPMALLPYVIDRLDADQLHEAVRRGGIPQEALAMIAVRALDEGEPRWAADLLEPVFSGPLERLDERHGHALNVLCDCYDALGWRRKKEALLEAVGRQAKRALQAEAWQRRATWQVDEGDIDAGWASFRKAQQAKPDDPSLAILEITLLMAEGRKAEAADRAVFWRKRLERLDVANEKILAMLDAISANPAGGLADVYLGATAPGVDRLRAWLEANAERPVPTYRVATLAETDLATARRQSALRLARLAQRLWSEDTQDRTWGPQHRTQAAPIAQLEDEYEDEDEDEWDDEAIEADERTSTDHTLSRTLVVSDPLAEIEDRWREVFPLEKSFGLPMAVAEDMDPWESDLAEEWLGFLEDEPAAFDSLDILDDLASLVEEIPTAQTPWTDEAVLRPLLERGKAIVERSLAPITEPFTLPWVVLDNRPALRLLTRWAYLLVRRGDAEVAAVMEYLLTLDPDDRQGLRAELMNIYLRAGDDDRAIALGERYGPDMLPDVPYGRVLALYRSRRLDEAREALIAARNYLPKVTDFLVKPSVKKPKMSTFGVTVGGDDQAWLYREAMLETWRAVPGLLEWLASQIRDGA
jgi:tetratricopeptide (TPR) repeat protein